jgi:predicted PurR-regulated permease PerM
MQNLELINNYLNGPLKDMLVPIICKELNIEKETIESTINLIKNDQGTKEQQEAINNIIIAFDKIIKEKYGFSINSGVSVENQISARNMQISTKSKIPGFLSVMITFGFFSVLGFMLLNDSKPNETLLILLGSLGTAWIAVVNYWFGSSSGSSYKSEILERIATK